MVHYLSRLVLPRVALHFLKFVVLMLLFSQPNIFSNIGKMSYWVEPVLSSGQSVLLKDTTR